VQRISLLLTTIAVVVAGLQGPANAPAVSTFHAVSYFEVLPSNNARTAAVAAMKAYNTAARSQDGFGNIESFEQVGRPGHFLLFETWRDATAFEKRDAAIQKQFTDALQSIRVSDIDRRPYKVMTIAARGQTNNQTVYVITHVDSSPSPQVPMMLQRLAENSRRETGNLRFDIYQHTMRANHFTVIEAWRNRQALDAHAAAPHTKQYRDEFGPMAGSPLDERLFEAVNP
jgi:quinol monooxygenase YgiN